MHESVLGDITFLANGQVYKRYQMDDLPAQHQISWFGRRVRLRELRKQLYERWLAWIFDRRQRMRQGFELGGPRPYAIIMRDVHYWQDLFRFAKWITERLAARSGGRYY